MPPRPDDHPAAPDAPACSHLTIPRAGRGGHTAHHTDYMARGVGAVSRSPGGPAAAGSWAPFELVFTAGRFGMDMP